MEVCVSRNNLYRKQSSIGWILFVGATIGNTAAIFSQTSAVDLTAPNLRTHARLPQNDHPGMPIQQNLTEAHALAASKTIPWKGLNTFVIDHPGGISNETLLQTYQKYVCLADAIAIGHTTLRLHHLSASGSAVYTDYVFVIDALLKDNRRSSIQTKREIVLTRPGGTLTLPEGSVTFENQEFPLLQPSTPYLVLLRYIPESGGYEAVDSLATLVQTETNWVIDRKTLAGRILPGFAIKSVDASIRLWLTSCK